MQTNREQIIFAARQEFADSAMLRRLTSEEAFVNDALRTAGEELLVAKELRGPGSPDPAGEFVVAQSVRIRL